MLSSPMLSTSKPRQGVLGDLLGDDVVRHHLGVVPGSLQKPVGHPGRPAGAPGDLPEPLRLGPDVEDARRALHDGAHRLVVVELQPVDGAEAVPQRRAHHAVPRGRADEGEGLDAQVHAPRLQTLVDHPRHEEVLHRRIEHLLDHPAQPVHLVDEQDVVLLQLGQDGHHVARTLNRRARRGLDLHAHLGGHDVGQRRLAQSGRPVQQQVVQGLAPLPRGRYRDAEVALDAVLADVFGQAPRPEVGVEGNVLLVGVAGDEALVHEESPLYAPTASHGDGLERAFMVRLSGLRCQGTWDAIGCGIIGPHDRPRRRRRGTSPLEDTGSGKQT